MTSLSYRHKGSLYLSILYFSCKYPFPLGSLKYTYICYSIALYDSLILTFRSSTLRILNEPPCYVRQAALCLACVGDKCVLLTKCMSTALTKLLVFRFP